MEYLKFNSNTTQITHYGCQIRTGNVSTSDMFWTYTFGIFIFIEERFHVCTNYPSSKQHPHRIISTVIFAFQQYSAQLNAYQFLVILWFHINKYIFKYISGNNYWNIFSLFKLSKYVFSYHCICQMKYTLPSSHHSL